MRKHAMVGIGMIALLVLVGGLAIAWSASAQQQADIATMVANAKSPADHEAIAQYYEREEAQAKTEAETHRKLAETYKKFTPEVRPGTEWKNMAEHCEEMARHYEAVAKDDAALAAAHRAEAKKGQ